MNSVTVIQLSPDDLRLLIEASVSKALANQRQLEAAPRKPEYQDVTMAADFLKVKKSTVYSYVNRGILPYVKVSGKLLFRTTDLTAYLESGHNLAEI